MFTFIALSLALAGALMLVASGLQHIRNHRPLLASLLAHRMLTYRSARLVARTLPGAQLVLGALLLLSLNVTLPSWLSRPVVAATSLLYLTMAAYLAKLMFQGRRADCNCFGGREPVTWFSCSRAFVPGVAAAFLALTPAALAREPRVSVLLVGGSVAALAMSTHRLASRLVRAPDLAVGHSTEDR